MTAPNAGRAVFEAAADFAGLLRPSAQVVEVFDRIGKGATAMGRAVAASEEKQAKAAAAAQKSQQQLATATEETGKAAGQLGAAFAAGMDRGAEAAAVASTATARVTMAAREAAAAERTQATATRQVVLAQSAAARATQQRAVAATAEAQAEARVAQAAAAARAAKSGGDGGSSLGAAAAAKNLADAEKVLTVARTASTRAANADQVAQAKLAAAVTTSEVAATNAAQMHAALASSQSAEATAATAASAAQTESAAATASASLRASAAAGTQAAATGTLADAERALTTAQAAERASMATITAARARVTATTAAASAATAEHAAAVARLSQVEGEGGRIELSRGIAVAQASERARLAAAAQASAQQQLTVAETAGAAASKQTAAATDLLVSARTALSPLARAQAAADAAAVSAQAGLSAATTRLSTAQGVLAAVQADGKANASELSGAQLGVARAEQAVAIAADRAAEAQAAQADAAADVGAASEEAAADVSEGAEASGEAAEAAADVSEGASDASASVEELGQNASVAGAALLAPFAAAQVMFSNFDSQMSSTAAAANVTGDELQQLRQAAIDAGSATFFSATEAAQGEEELAKAGIGVSDVVNGALSGALDLAAAGGLAVADAASTAATAMTVFGLSGAAVPHVADVLAAAAGKAQGDVSDLTQALNQSALVANQTGLSFEDTAGALALFASNGLIGSDAGTSFRTMLLALNPQSDQAGQLMDELGIKSTDAQGGFIGMAKYAQLLHDKLSPLPDDQRNAALQTIFGSDAIRAATIVMNAGADGVQEWTTAVNDSGYAQEQASAKMDNLKGDVEQLGGAFQSLVLANSGPLNGMLRTLAQYVTADVQSLSSLPPVVGQVGTGLGVTTGALLLMGGAFTVLNSSLGNIATRFLDVATSQSRMAGAAAFAYRATSLLQSSLAIGIPLVAAAVVGYSIWARKQQENKAAVDALTQSLDAQNGSVTDNTRSIVQQALESEGAAEAAQTLGVSQRDLVDAALGNADALGRVKDATSAAEDAWKNSSSTNEDYVAGLAENKAAADVVNRTLDDQTGKVSKAQSAWERANEAQDANGQAAQEAAQKQAAASTQINATTVSMRGQTDAATVLKTALDQLSGKAISAEQANLTLQAGLNQMASTTANAAAQYAQAAKDGDALAMAQNAGAYSLTQLNPATGTYTAAVVQNRQAVIGAIQQANSHAQAVFEQTHSVDAATAALNTDKAALEASATAAGLNKAEVQKLIDTYYATPAEVTTAMTAQTDAASKKVLDFRGLIDQIPASKNVTFYADTDSANASVQRFVEATNNRVAYVQVQTVGPNGGSGGKQVFEAGGVVEAYAAGGIRTGVRSFAPGGMEMQTPQIGTPGSVARVWNEPNRQGEAYVPFAMQYRKRAESILGDVAERFGGSYTPSTAAALMGEADRAATSSLIASSARPASVGAVSARTATPGGGGAAPLVGTQNNYISNPRPEGATVTVQARLRSVAAARQRR